MGAQQLSGWQKAGIVASVLAAIATFLGALQAIGVIDVAGDDEKQAQTVPTTVPKIPDVSIPDIRGGEASLRLSRTSGPPGTRLTVSGSGFEPFETVEIDFQTQRVATTKANAQGNLEKVPIQIPPDWPFQGQQFPITAVGRSSIQHIEEPFTVE